MILYHGTNITFETIDLLKSKPNKDFGQGFYLTTDKNQAIEMAKAKIDQQGQGKVIVYTYEFDDNLLNDSSLKIKTFDNYTEEWALFILANRNNFSSKGSLNASNTTLLYSVNSSRNNIPLCAKLISPGIGSFPPPIIDFIGAV